MVFNNPNSLISHRLLSYHQKPLHYEVEVYFLIRRNKLVIQSGHVNQMLYPPCVILQELSSYTSLETSDIIMTGTSKGVGIVLTGDRFTGRIKSESKTLVEAEWIAEKY